MPPVDCRQYAGHTQADGADVCIGWGVGIIRAAGAEHLALGQQLSMHLQPDDNLVVHDAG